MPLLTPQAVATEAPSGPQDVVQIGVEKPDPQKEQVIRSIIRKAPDEASRQSVVEALSAYPIHVLERVLAYGTRIEVYDFAGGDAVPNYLPTLAHPNTLGSYNTKANVLGIDKSNLSPFTLIHEFAHALDASLKDKSETPEWKNAHAGAAATGQAVRKYAEANPSEYMAENVTAYLVSDEALVPLIERGLSRNIGTEGMTEREYWQMHQNFCHGRLQRMDPQAYSLVEKMLHEQARSEPRLPELPAMTEEQWEVFKSSQN